MSAFKFAVTATLALALAQPFTGFAAGFGAEMDGPGSNGEPTPATMVADTLIARPLYAAATILGTAVFLVALPFSALGRNVKESANALVVGPAQGLLTRCLGCTQTLQETNVERAAD